MTEIKKILDGEDGANLSAPANHKIRLYTSVLIMWIAQVAMSMP